MLFKIILAVIITFLIDLILVSFITGKIRLWFPQWFNPFWESSSLVTYSQSYTVGIAFIPLFFYIIDKEMVKTKRNRILNYLLMSIVLFLVCWWKGDLMLKYGKYIEDLIYIIVGFLLYFILSQILKRKVPRFVNSSFFYYYVFLGVGILLSFLAVVDLAFAINFNNFIFGLYVELAALLPAGMMITSFSIWKIKKMNTLDGKGGYMALRMGK